MMAVDASAVLAVVLEEEAAAVYNDALANAVAAAISAVNYWEVLVRARVLRGESGAANAEAFMSGAELRVVSADAESARAAAVAFARFGRRTPAGLNLGDCFAYALAQQEGAGLLYKGNDFSKTDVESAL